MNTFIRLPVIAVLFCTCSNALLCAAVDDPKVEDIPSLPLLERLKYAMCTDSHLSQEERELVKAAFASLTGDDLLQGIRIYTQPEHQNNAFAFARLARFVAWWDRRGKEFDRDACVGELVAALERLPRDAENMDLYLSSVEEIPDARIVAFADSLDDGRADLKRVKERIRENWRKHLAEQQRKAKDGRIQPGTGDSSLTGTHHRSPAGGDVLTKNKHGLPLWLTGSVAGVALLALGLLAWKKLRA